MRMEFRTVSEGGTLNESAVGKNGDIYPDGAGKPIKAGARIRFNMHYHSVGQEITDETSNVRSDACYKLACPTYRLPAAYAQPRQGAVHGRNLPEHGSGATQLREPI